MQLDAAQAFRKEKNLVLLSPTGTGKTLAYMLPLVEELSRRHEEQALVVVPSRELAKQTAEVCRQTGTGIRCVALYGGRPAMEEHRRLREVQPQLIVGTPGRLLDHLHQGNIEGSRLRTIVIDEFDKCLEMGFRREMAELFSMLPDVERRMLLSATDKEEMTQFMPEYHLLNYLDTDESEERLEEFRVDSPVKDKLETLGQLLRQLGGGQSSIVFVGFRESVERVAHYLRGQGFCVSQLHGGMEQRDRERQLFRFMSGSANILVSTDLASRGLDIDRLDNVIHYHLPQTDDIRTHRNGRTARWDQQGRILYIVGPEEHIGDAASQFSVPAQCPVFTPSHEAGGGDILPLWQTLYIGKGRKDKLSRGDIMGFLSKVGGLGREDVGRIDVFQHQSYAAIRRERVGETLLRLRGQKIKGLRTLFEVIRD